VAQDYVQDIARKFDAHQPLPVEAYDRGMKKFGHGALVGIDNQIEPTTATLKCKASLVPEGDNLMFPGLTLNIRLRLETKRGVLVVPTAAVQRNPQGSFVWVLKPDDTVTCRPVTVAVTEGDETGLEAGVSPGEQVVISDMNRMHEGASAAGVVIHHARRDEAATGAKGPPGAEVPERGR
jgi:multidrug efflux system membrane fusion protein